MKKYFLLILTLCFVISISLVYAQTGAIEGQIFSKNEPVAFANIGIKELNRGTSSDENGFFKLENIEFGTYTLVVSTIGFELYQEHITLSDDTALRILKINLQEDQQELEQVVITGTRTAKKQSDSPIMVGVINSQTLGNVQACNLSEGLKFQAGLRVETDCQTCNYTQLRMNGLAGGYSQILINGRPIFSPLTGLYGMEQIPTNMIERIEVVRGGGSSLYGSSAVGGTVNVITKIPKENGFNLGYTYQNINGANDHTIDGNATLVSRNDKKGLTFFVNHRNRDFYDHNGDNFSELPKLTNNALGATAFFRPTQNQKLEANLSYLNEYRFGGEMLDTKAHLAQQAEERTHHVWVGNIDYQLNFNDNKSNLISYLATQHTRRSHYTGIFPDQIPEIEQHLQNPPYGSSLNSTYQVGLQINHTLKNFIYGNAIMTFGTEFVSDDILDTIEAYNYKIDQTTTNLGVFLQHDWQFFPALNLLTGVRLDKHNFLENLVMSPRLALLYQVKKNLQVRLSWAKGFRAPQAFDTDLHIAFAGGGISRITLSENLKEERSTSWSGSINYDKANENFIAGFTLEGFYTTLNNAFYLQPTGVDTFGETFVKSNGKSATVQGITLELRANYTKKIQFESGFTLQSSLFDSPIANIEGLESKREFLRTPNHYGYATLSFFPSKKWQTTISSVYTGKMLLVHFAGAPEQPIDDYQISRSFTELNLKISYTIPISKSKTSLEVVGGTKNILNQYQNDFDSGKNRDSNYIYGTSFPRTFFIGLRIKQ